jgi:hypothetical protein
MTERSNYPNEVEVRQRDLEFTETTKSRQIRQTRIDVFGDIGGRAEGLVVTVNGTTATLVDVSAGRGYTPNGELVELASAQTDIALSDYTDGVDNFVCLVYTEVETTPAPHETDGTTRNVRTEAVTSVGVFTQAELDALPATLVDNTQTARDRVVIIATVNADGAGNDLEAADITQPDLLDSTLDIAAALATKLNRDGSNTVTGNILPSAANSWDLGSSSVPFDVLFATAIVLPGTSIASATGLGFVSCTELTVSGTPLGSQGLLIETPTPQLIINNSAPASVTTLAMSNNAPLATNRMTMFHSPDGGGAGIGLLEIDVGGGSGLLRLDSADVTMTNDASVQGALNVTGNIDGNGTLDIAGTSNLQGEVDCGDDLNVAGNLFVTGTPFKVSPQSAIKYFAAMSAHLTDGAANFVDGEVVLTNGQRCVWDLASILPVELTLNLGTVEVFVTNNVDNLDIDVVQSEHESTGGSSTVTTIASGNNITSLTVNATLAQGSSTVFENSYILTVTNNTGGTRILHGIRLTFTTAAIG